MIRLKISKSQWQLALGLALFWSLFVVVRGSETLTLEHKWKDHLNNLAVTQIFLKHGMKVASEPKESFASIWPADQDLPAQFSGMAPKNEVYSFEGKPVYFAWPNAPNPYSPGAYVFFYPFSFLTYDLNLGYKIPCFLFALSLLVIAHWIFFILLNHFSQVRDELQTGRQKFFFYLIFFLIYCELCRWPLNGQYETMALPFIVLSFAASQRQGFAKALTWLGMAFAFHPRALFFLPQSLLWFFKWLKAPKKAKDFLFLLIAAMGAAVLAYTMLLTLKVHNDPAVFRTLNKWGLYAITQNHDYGRMSILALAVTFISIVIYRFRYFQLLTLFLWIHLLLFQSAQIRQWYVTFLIAFFFLYPPRFQFLCVAGLAYFGIAEFYPNNSPFEFTFVKAVVQSLWDPGLTQW